MRRIALLSVLFAFGCASEETYGTTCDNPPKGMVCVPEGEFEMGVHDPFMSEHVTRTIWLPDYAIDVEEVTTAEYAACVEDRGCSELATGALCATSFPEKKSNPANCATWFNADEYCRWAGLRLPTEAEWEKAAAGTDGRKHPWGDEQASCDLAVIALDDDALGGCGRDHTLPVGSKSPAGDSPYGVRDMQGNISEWVSDWFAEYDPDETSNPQGPESGDLKILRGSAWLTTADFHELVHVSYREPFPPDAPNAIWMGIGFRCARDLD